MDEQWIGPAVFTALSTLGGIAYAGIRAWRADRARRSRAETTVALAQAGVPARDIPKLVRATDESSEEESSER
jgi:hypothetical protein